MTHVSREPWSMARRVAIVSANRMFAGLGPATIAAIATRFLPRTYPKGTTIFLSGQRSVALHILAEGHVKIVRECPDGRQVILRFISPGEMFGAAGGWGESQYPATAETQEPVTTLEALATELPALVMAHPDFGLALIAELAARLREAERRIQELHTMPVEQRLAGALARLIARSADHPPTFSLTRQALAELSGTTLSTVSRCLSTWERAGMVRGGRGRVTITDVAALCALAEGMPRP